MMEMNLTSKGQVTIPKIFREAIGVKPGGKLQFNLEGDRIILTNRKANTPPADEKRVAADRKRRMMEALRGLSDVDLSTEEIMRMSRGNDWNSPTPHD